MSVPTRVFENGQWVTRYEDLYEIMARNRVQQTEEKAQPSLNLDRLPRFSILTKSLVRSPIVKWIIPARIRHESKNDVLFISSDTIQIKEAHLDYALKDVIVKDDFDSPIKAVRIIGAPRKLTPPDINAIIKQEEPDELDTTEIKEERDQSSGPTLLQTRTIPPQFAVLALESNKLVFFLTVSGDAAHPQIVCSHKILPAAQSCLEQLGEHLAVDSKSRAMAVAAGEDALYLYALWPLSELEKQLKEGFEIRPIKAEKLLRVDGIILNMEFLHPIKDDDHVVLLLTVSKNGRSKLVWYEWNSKTELHQAQISPKVQGLPSEDRLPLFLVPLTKFTAFIIVCENHLTLYKDILTGSPSRYVHRPDCAEDPEEPGDSRRKPIWVQWVRPMRQSRQASNRDQIYLCREDGIVHFYDIDCDKDQPFNTTTHNVGALGINMSSAFASVDLGPQTDDLLVAGCNDSSDGGIWRFSPRQDAKQQSVHPNWTPLVDLAVSAMPALQRPWGQAESQLEGKERLFACHGKGKHGAISELRFGIKAEKKVTTVDISDEVKSGILGIWTLLDSRDDSIYVLMSHSTRTSMMRMQPMRDPELVEGGLGLDLTTRTLAARGLFKGLAIQVTERSVNAVSTRPSPNKVPQKSLVFTFDVPCMLATCIEVSSEFFVLACVQQNDQFFLHLVCLGHEYRSIGHRVQLRSHPSCVMIQKIGNQILGFVGTLQGTLQMFLTDENFDLCEVTEYAFGSDFGICNSIATTTSLAEVDSSLIICGLRNGMAHMLFIHKADSSYELVLREKLTIGHTSVTVITDTTDPSRAVLHCDESLYTLNHPQGSHGEAPALLHSLWITDRAQPAMQQKRLSAIAQTDYFATKSQFGAGYLACVDGDLLHLVDIDQNPEPRCVPRRLQIGGTPVRVIYSHRLNRLIVLYYRKSVTRHSNEYRNRPGKRALRPVIGLLNPDDDAESVELCPTKVTNDAQFATELNAVDADNDHFMTTMSEGTATKGCIYHKPGERFLGVTEWFPTVARATYHMLIVNTLVKSLDDGAPNGRLLFFSVDVSGSGPPKLVLKKDMDLSAPVYSVAFYPPSSIIYCCASELCKLSLEPYASGIKWMPPIKAAMRSPGRHITVEEPWIYVSTANESLAVFQYDTATSKLIYRFGDQVARSGLHHVNLPQHSLILAADMSGSVIGLWQPPQPRLDNSLGTVFEAVLPNSITRLRRMRPAIRHAKSLEDGDEIIIGSSTDGTITQFTILTKGWRMLRFMQNMAERSPIVCPFNYEKPKRHIEPSRAKPTFMHIDGDILKRILERGDEALLREMLDREPHPKARYLDFDTAADRWKLFREAAAEVVNVEGDEWLEDVISWLRVILRNAF